MVLPISVVITRAVSSHAASSASAAACIHRARSSKVVRRYVIAVAAARAMHSSTSASVNASKVFSISPVAGFVVAIAMTTLYHLRATEKPPGPPTGAGCQDGRVIESPFTSSPFVGAIEPITESEAEIRAFLDAAEVPPLLPALAYLTGDLSLLREELRPDPLLLAMPQSGLAEP